MMPIIDRKLCFSVGVIVFLSLITAGCGYHRIGDERNGELVTTLCIPYFCNDKDGRLTEAVVRACEKSSFFRYASSHKGGRWLLQGELCSDVIREIGYNYDRDPESGKRQHRLVPVEGRSKVKVKVSLIDIVSGNTVFGPFIVEANSDFDFINPNSPKDGSFELGNKREETILFSLGQLDSRFGAENAASCDAYQKVAEKIFLGLDNLIMNADLGEDVKIQEKVL